MSDEQPPSVREPDPPSTAPTEAEAPGGLVGLLVGGVQAVVALLGRLLSGLFTAVLGNLMGKSAENSDGDEGSEGD